MPIQTVFKICFLVIASISLLFSYSCRSTSKTFSDELRTAASWAAAVHKAGEKWLAGAVPTDYAANTFQAAEQALEDLLNKLQSLRTSEDIRARALESLQHIKNITHAMQDTVKKEERNELNNALNQLATEEQAIALLIKGNEPQ